MDHGLSTALWPDTWLVFYVGIARDEQPRTEVCQRVYSQQLVIFLRHLQQCFLFRGYTSLCKSKQIEIMPIVVFLVTPSVGYRVSPPTSLIGLWSVWSSKGCPNMYVEAFDTKYNSEGFSMKLWIINLRLRHCSWCKGHKAFDAEGRHLLHMARCHILWL